MYTISKTESRVTLKVIEAKAEENDTLFRTLEATWNHLITSHFYLDDEVFAAQIGKAVQEGINDRKSKQTDNCQIFPKEVRIREGIAATILWSDMPVGHHIVKHKSTRAAILEFLENSAGWAGDDFKKCLDEVYAMRGKVKFDVPDGHESGIVNSHQLP